MNRVDEIKQRVTMRQIAELYGLEIRHGFAHCPFHSGDRTASLKIYDDAKGWHCFGCDKGGSVIDFVMEAEHIPFTAACKRLDAVFGLNLYGDITPEEKRAYRAYKAAQQEKQRQAEYSAQQELILIQFRRWLADHNGTAEDIQYIDRLLDCGEFNYDAAARVAAVRSKYEN